MLKSLALLLLGVAAAQFAPSSAAQVVPRVAYGCDGCVTKGTLDDVDLEGALAMKGVGSGTYFFAVDGARNTSVVYQATTVNALDYPWQPNRELPGGRYLVMRRVANPFTALANTMLAFYHEEPVGWIKEFTPFTSQFRLARGIATQSLPVPIASLTFPAPDVTVWEATQGGQAQNALLNWANNNMSGQGARVQQYLGDVAQNLATTATYGSPATVVITVRFQDGSSVRLVADTTSPTGEFRLDRTYGSARDKSNNTVPINDSQVGGEAVGDTAVYNFSNSPEDLQKFLARVNLWEIQLKGAQSSGIACTATTDENKNVVFHCQFY